MPGGWLTALQLHQWRQRYDEATAQPGPVPFAAEGWGRCYSSDLKRAFVTAQALYTGEIIQTPLLREPEIRQFRTGSLTLPIGMWRWIMRLAWMTGHASQRSARDDFANRVQQVAELVESSECDMLLVSHAGMMAYLRGELLQRGFQGPKFRVPEHARLYVFEKEAKAAASYGDFQKR
jgi:broad specificity phosphatase PhoE